MKRHSKAILLGLGALFGVLAAGLFCANLYVQSASAQERIRAQFSAALGMPLKLTKTSFSPWSGLRITGITIPDGDTAFLEAGSFTAGCRLLPLLVGKFSVPEVRVDQPKLVWKQKAGGKWQLPKLEKSPAAPGESRVQGSAPAEKGADGRLVLNVGRILVTGGSVELLDEAGLPLAVLTGVTVTCTTVSAAKVEGTAVAGRLVWEETLVFENVRTPFRWAAGELTLPELTGTLAGGAVKGSFRAQPEQPKSPFEAAVDFQKVNLERLAAEAGWQAGQATGSADGRLALHGDMGRLGRAKGTGQIQLRDGRFKQLELFQAIGRVLDIRELSDLRIEEGRGDFHIADEKLHVDQAILRALNLQLSAKGTVGFDQKVALGAQLGLEEGLVKQLPDLILGSFGKAGDGQRTIDFRITGTTEKLRTDLADRLIGQKINRQFDELLGGIFGGKNPEEEKKKKEEEERKKEEKKRKKEQDKAAAKAAKAAAAAASPAAATPPSPAPATTAITPAKP